MTSKELEIFLFSYEYNFSCIICSFWTADRGIVLVALLWEFGFEVKKKNTEFWKGDGLAGKISWVN